MAFTLEGFEVYTSDFDDRGIDFVTRSPNGTLYTVQVKTTGPTVSPFIYEKNFERSDYFLFVAVRIEDGVEPTIYIAKGTDWFSSDTCLHNNPGGGKAGPYYEMRFGSKYREQLAKYQFENYVSGL